MNVNEDVCFGEASFLFVKCSCIVGFYSQWVCHNRRPIKLTHQEEVKDHKWEQIMGSPSILSRGSCVLLPYHFFPNMPKPCNVCKLDWIHIRSYLSLWFLCLQKEEVICLADGMFLLHLARRCDSQQTVAIACALLWISISFLDLFSCYLPKLSCVTSVPPEITVSPEYLMVKW